MLWKLNQSDSPDFDRVFLCRLHTTQLLVTFVELNIHWLSATFVVKYNVQRLLLELCYDMSEYVECMWSLPFKKKSNVQREFVLWVVQQICYIVSRKTHSYIPCASSKDHALIIPSLILSHSFSCLSTLMSNIEICK